MQINGDFWAHKLQEAQKRTNTLRSFRIKNTIDERLKKASEATNLSYTKIVNIALEDFLEKFDKIESSKS